MMKCSKSLLPPALACLLLAGCSYGQFSAVATGGSLGGMFGSSIGGLIGGPRGADAGAVIGMLAGGGVGAAVTADRTAGRRSGGAADGVEYGTYDTPAYRSRMKQPGGWDGLEVSAVKYLDGNGNGRLDAGESACIVFDIHNRGGRTLYNVAPVIACDNRKVLLSPPAIVSELPPGGGVRYKAEVRAPRRLREGTLNFSVSFGAGEEAVTVKNFSVPAGA